MRCWSSPRRSMSCRTLWMACSGYFCRTQGGMQGCVSEGVPNTPAHREPSSLHSPPLDPKKGSLVLSAPYVPGPVLSLPTL